jgi:CRP-like cAMP-binding protein
VADLAAVLRVAPFFCDGSPASIERLARTARVVRRAAGEDLWAEGAPALDVLLLTGGLVEIARRNRSGDDATMALFGPEEVIGLSAGLGGGVYPATARAVSDEVTAVAVPALELRAAIDRDHALARAANHTLIEHDRVLRATIAVLTAGAVEQRIAALFMHLAARFGHFEDGALHISLALSRRTIAQLVDARVETVIRTLSAWRKATIADAGDTVVIHDVAALRALADAPRQG